MYCNRCGSRKLSTGFRCLKCGHDNRPRNIEISAPPMPETEMLMPKD